MRALLSIAACFLAPAAVAQPATPAVDPGFEILADAARHVASGVRCPLSYADARLSGAVDTPTDRGGECRYERAGVLISRLTIRPAAGGAPLTDAACRDLPRALGVRGSGAYAPPSPLPPDMSASFGLPGREVWSCSHQRASNSPQGMIIVDASAVTEGAWTVTATYSPPPARSSWMSRPRIQMISTDEVFWTLRLLRASVAVS